MSETANDLRSASRDRRGAAIAAHLIAAHRREFGTIPKGLSAQEFRAFHERRRSNEAMVVAQLAALAERDGLLLPVRWGGHAAATPDLIQHGKWRVTAFTASMQPAGHTTYGTLAQALREMVYDAAITGFDQFDEA